MKQTNEVVEVSQYLIIQRSLSQTYVITGSTNSNTITEVNEVLTYASIYSSPQLFSLLLAGHFIINNLDTTGDKKAQPLSMLPQGRKA